MVKQTVTLNNGNEMPAVGYGTFRVKDSNELSDMVVVAIKEGYRHIDTAHIYQNEESVGLGIKKAIDEGLVTREELFVTSKVWNDGLTYDETIAAYEESLRKLGLDYLDLYIIHWPGLDENYVEIYKALEELYNNKRVKNIGVSNFHVHHLETLLSKTSVVPTVNQIEFQPKLTQVEVREYCKKHGIQVEAWSPLMNGEILNHEVLVDIAKKYNKSTAQIVLKWDLENDVITIPKSMTPSRIRENLELFDFELTQDEIDKISSLNEGFHFGPNPDEYNFNN
ncbi:aldo/keto reductase [Rummeliibacillus stabekisii]|uniref:aldo/keto reductase n=1 Tax=Rummeliibacillus stabekisii TaxID=241244 RepID=UPI0011712AA5|nr:aldo/keto reductase [Rummeliibacillus stabekisii]MBB5169272.1 diketogulonate reductase-like aldo/keto reductase [Rummeliibacillus stabekisii]GEL03532.1 glyoxal reductase [Rummeliibacillus stabekisii]